jgi:heme oxygenase
LPERADLNATKAIKVWFREGLDKAGDMMSEEQRLQVVEEARQAFIYNIGVFSSFDKPMQEWLEKEEAAKEANLVGVAVKEKRNRVPEETSWLTVALVMFAASLVLVIGFRSHPVLDI